MNPLDMIATVVRQHTPERGAYDPDGVDCHAQGCGWSSMHTHPDDPYLAHARHVASLITEIEEIAVIERAPFVKAQKYLAPREDLNPLERDIVVRLLMEAETDV